MLNISEISLLRQQIQAWKQRGERIAFVATMGNLHAGHLQLVDAARARAERVVVSVFVNPLQFNDASDFTAYPRTLNADAHLLSEAQVDVLFAPTVDVMYPQGQARNTKVMLPGLSEILEGEHRPGHFTGVATVVAKLFNMVQPDVALFGEKDFQQLLLIRRMVVDLDMPIEIVGLPTVREADGLAMSSRNSRLGIHERQIAPTIYQTLCKVRKQLSQGERQYLAVEQQATAELNRAGFRTEYVALRRALDLQPPADDDKQLVLLVAVHLGRTRLIDNIPLCL